MTSRGGDFAPLPAGWDWGRLAQICQTTRFPVSNLLMIAQCSLLPNYSFHTGDSRLGEHVGCHSLTRALLQDGTLPHCPCVPLSWPCHLLLPAYPGAVHPAWSLSTPLAGGGSLVAVALSARGLCADQPVFWLFACCCFAANEPNEKHVGTRVLVWMAGSRALRNMELLAAHPNSWLSLPLPSPRRPS